MRRIRLNLAPDLQVEFADRERALSRIKYWAEHGMGVVQVVYGPEGCGKTAWLLQAIELLRDYGFDVIYINPIERDFLAEVGIEDIRRRLIEILREVTGDAWARAAWAIIDLVKELIRAGRRRIAVLADDVFQAIGLDRAAIYIKGGLLGLIEYPPRDYDVVITVAATSEGVSLREIGRHRWADLLAMWNMSREGFRQLYEQIPGVKPNFDEVWRLTGGNPKLLGRLYEINWSVDDVINRLVRGKELISFIQSLNKDDRELLMKALEDPDALMSREGIPLMNKLVELNLVIDNIYPPRDETLWIDQPPPDKDLGLGIGKYVAWQSPLHRDAVKRTLGGSIE
ncbi:ATP-binding protein [Vulcanisaeta distributa]|uniref:ATP-binding protein n=1 Tax=Vulcanisaeta distributa TaxID=164451 RepID=UPI0006D20F97|nr:ATP-binding protein [Vulcanisaeta distributa]